MSDDLRATTDRARRFLVRFRRPLSAAIAALATLAAIETLAPAAPELRPVVVAARDLASGTALTASDLRVVRVPPSVVPDGATLRPGRLVGRRLAGPVRRGEPLTDRRVIGPSLIAGYPAGLVAVPVRLRDDTVATLLQVGARVDVFAARQDTPYADAVVTGVRVVALPESSPDGLEGGLVVLAVTADQAAALAQAGAVAPLTVALLR